MAGKIKIGVGAALHSFLFGLRGKIFVAMGTICLLLAVIAGLALNIISDNLAVSSHLVTSSNELSVGVRKVSDSIQQTLENQQEQRVKFNQLQEEQSRQQLDHQVELYQRVLGVQNALNSVARKSSLIINDGEPYQIVAKDVSHLKNELDIFFAMPDLARIEEEKVKGASRAARGYLQMYEELQALDAENVSMSQQIELVVEAQGIGKSLENRMALVLDGILSHAEEHIVEQREAARQKLQDSLVADQETLAAILARQAEIRQTVAGNVKQISELESFLLAKRRYLVMAAVIALVLGVTFSVLIVRVITRPLIRAVAIAKGIAEGDLDQEVDIQGSDELGQLGDSMSIMIDNLRFNRHEIESSVARLDEVAAMVSSSLEEISANMEEINSMSQQNLLKAKSMREMSDETQKSAGQGKSRMAEMLGSMNEVNAASQEIAKIIKVINDIAFQTNLLALNAAVEAAHAGEQGQGFAVVADEVRSLAGRCASAANDTTILIEGPMKKIGEATEKAGRLAEALDSIHASVAGMAGVIKEISDASEDQSAGITQTNHGLSQIEQAAMGLASQTDQLTSTLERFKKQGGQTGEPRYLPES